MVTLPESKIEITTKGNIICDVCDEVQKTSQKRCLLCGFTFLTLQDTPKKPKKIPPRLPDETKCACCGSDSPINTCHNCIRLYCNEGTCWLEQFEGCICSICDAKNWQRNKRVIRSVHPRYNTKEAKRKYLLQFNKQKRKVLYQTLLSTQIPVEVVDFIWAYHSDIHIVEISVPNWEKVIYKTSTGTLFEWEPESYGEWYRNDLEQGIQKWIGCSPGEVRILSDGHEVKDDIVVCQNWEMTLEGRPFLNEKNSYSMANTLTNPISSDWSYLSSASDLHSKSTFLSRLGSLEVREWLAQQWENDGLAEHASIGSFARHLLELLAVGAPSALIADVQRAAGDEIIHTKLCFKLASLYRGMPVEPGAFPISSSQVTIRTDVSSMATGTAIEGCVEETLSAVCAYVTYRSYLALDENERSPFLHNTLQTLSQDEIRHAALAWKTLVWACEKGGIVTCEAVRDAFEKRFSTKRDSGECKEELIIEPSKLIAYGRLSKQMQRTVIAVAVKFLIKPWSQLVLKGGFLQTPLPKLDSMTEEVDFVLSAGNAILADVRVLATL